MRPTFWKKSIRVSLTGSPGNRFANLPVRWPLPRKAHRGRRFPGGSVSGDPAGADEGGEHSSGTLVCFLRPEFLSGWWDGFLEISSKWAASLGQPETEEEMACVQGRAPVSGLLDYGRELTSYTRGRGTLSLRPDGYEPCKNREAAVAEIGYDPERDTENPAGSVFCSHGAGFPVSWQEADRYMHLGLRSFGEEIIHNKKS